MATPNTLTLNALCAAARSHGSLTPAGYTAENAEWIVAPCGLTRDSEIIDESNHEVALARYMAIDPAGDDWATVRFGHFAVGWIDEIIVRPGSACAAAAEQMRADLDGYPILDDDDDVSERECELEDENWGSIMADLRRSVVHALKTRKTRKTRGDYADDATAELAIEHAEILDDGTLTTFAYGMGESSDGWREYSSSEVSKIADLVEADARIKATEGDS